MKDLSIFAFLCSLGILYFVFKALLKIQDNSEKNENN